MCDVCICVYGLICASVQYVVCVCMSVLMNLFVRDICVCMCSWAAREYVCVHVSTCVSVCVCVWECLYMCFYLYVCVCGICMCTCLHMSFCLFVWYMLVHVCTCFSVCVCVYELMVYACMSVCMLDLYAGVEAKCQHQVSSYMTSHLSF